MRLLNLLSSVGVLGTALMLCSCESKQEQHTAPDITFVVAADLHFDYLPETDQFCHVVAINKLPGTFVWPDSSLFAGDTLSTLSSVIIAGDIFDKPIPEAIDLCTQRYFTQGGGERQLSYPCFPGYGNHDINPFSKDSIANLAGRAAAFQFMDSLLSLKQQRGEIENLHPSSRSYSWTDRGVYFVQLQAYGGDTTYCESNLDWLRDDLALYAKDGKPVVVVQHYGFDKWAIEWWPQTEREQLFDILEPYNIKGFFVGHTHTASVQNYRGIPIYQVNNAWPDGRGKASFAVARIAGNQLSVVNCQWIDSVGTHETTAPFLNRIE